MFLFICCKICFVYFLFDYLLMLMSLSGPVTMVIEKPLFSVNGHYIIYCLQYEMLFHFFKNINFPHFLAFKSSLRIIKTHEKLWRYFLILQ